MGENQIKITREDLVKLIKNTKGSFFTVVFIKKDGSIRKINARLGVKAYLKGGTLPYNPIEKGLIPVFDVQKKAYRMINTNTIQSAVIGGVNYIISSI